MNKMKEQAKTRQPKLGSRPSGQQSRPASAKGKFSFRPHFVQMLKKRIAMPRSGATFLRKVFYRHLALQKTQYAIAPLWAMPEPMKSLAFSNFILDKIAVRTRY